MLTLERLKEILSYAPETGLFTRLCWVGGNARKDTIAGVEHDGRYIRISIDGKPYYAHRLAWLYMTGEWPEDDIDHKDLNGFNNRWINLREATRTQNSGNVHKRCTNTSGIKGIWWNKYHQKWTAEIMINQKKIHIGHFVVFEDAVKARHEADEKYFGQYKRIEQLEDVA